MKIKTSAKIIAFLLMAVMLLTVASCGNTPSDDNGGSTEAASGNTANTESQTEPETSAPIDKDREGNSITLPATIDKIISMGASNTEILIALGCGDKIIASDNYSSNVEGIKSDIPLFSTQTPDGEQIIGLQPDVIFVTGMSKAGGDDPFKVVSDTGICVIYIPSSVSIEGIKEDIRYLAEVMKVQTKGEDIIASMEKDIADIKTIGDSITDKKSVYFEIGAAPYMYSLGKNTFINEMIELIGAVNVLGDQESWISVADEAVLNTNPDVILTSVNYIENPTEEIKARPGWEVIPAVANGEVYYIDTDSSNRPSQNIVKALKEMAKAIYPDKYN